MSDLHKEIAGIVLEAVNMEDIEVTEDLYSKALNAEPFQFDSIDFLEAVVAIEENYNIKLESPDQAPQHFKCINSIADFVNSHKKP